MTGDILRHVLVGISFLIPVYCDELSDNETF